MDVGGRYWWLWILLPTRAGPKGDGMYFQGKETISQSGIPLDDTMCLSSNTVSVVNGVVSDRINISRERIEC